MDKNLEIIKENAILILQLDPESEGSEIMKECQKEIIAHAERMAVEIEQTKNIAHDFEIGYDEAQKEIDRLKAELEKRPEVIECEYCFNWRYTPDHIMTNCRSGKCRKLKMDTPANFYCGAGVKKENEGER